MREEDLELDLREEDLLDFFEGLYPNELALPDSPEMARREIKLAKECGFNMIRPWRKPPPPWKPQQIEACRDSRGQGFRGGIKKKGPGSQSFESLNPFLKCNGQ